MEIKIAKWVDDECFGEMWDQIEQCNFCWIKKACNSKWKNRKPEEIEKQAKRNR